MFTLSRRVRFAVSPAGAPARNPNGYAGVPAMHGLGAHYEITLRCTGSPDPVTGYLVSITDLDRAVRDHTVGPIAHALCHAPETHPAALLPALCETVAAGLRARGAVLDELTWHLSPFYSVTMNAHDTGSCTLRQRFEFAASHRLHADALSDEENRRVYGKCNNPSGHGHNYVVEPAVRVPLGPQSPPPMTLTTLEAVVTAAVIDRFDHKDLNRDVDDFTAAVPSVEHIARRCYELLDEPIARAGGRLTGVTVWETEKTSCTYAPDAVAQ